MAPELIQKKEKYNQKIDIWSFGIFAIELSNGEPPYITEHQDRVLFNILKNSPPSINNRFSNDFKDFVARCLVKNPEKRADAKELLDHPFIASANNFKSDFVNYARQWKEQSDNPFSGMQQGTLK